MTKGYVLQFAHPPPPFGGVIQSVVQQGQSHFLREEIVSLLRKEAISVTGVNVIHLNTCLGAGQPISFCIFAVSVFV